MAESPLEEWRQLVASRPLATTPPWDCAEPNQPITLYTGAVTITQGGKSVTADGRVVMRWLPTPGFRFDVPEVPVNDFLSVGEAEVELADGTHLDGAYVSKLSPFSSLGRFQCRAAGWFQDRVKRTGGKPANHALFLMPNLDARHGEVLRDPNDGTRCGRLCLAADPWRITLDEIAGRDGVTERLKSESGFGVTHVGKLERIDGQIFDATAANGVLDALAAYSSFANGRWTGPCLPVGFDANGAKMWESWRGSRTSGYRNRETWMDVGDPICSCYVDPFAGFFKLWQDDYWREVLYAAIHWFVEACSQAGSIEGSIVLTQTAFELLGSAVLVEKYGWLSSDIYEGNKLPAADKVRLLLKWAGIPTTIPAALEELTKLAKADNWTDLPDAITAIRNKITHPTAKNRKAAQRHTTDGRRECHDAGLWCLEWLLLRLFEYRGQYRNRLSQKFVGQTEPVPWAITT